MSGLAPGNMVCSKNGLPVYRAVTARGHALAWWSAGAAPAAKRPADPERPERAAVANAVATRLFERGRVAHEGLDGRGAGLLGLGAGSPGQRRQGERRRSHGDRKLAHRSLIVAGIVGKRDDTIGTIRWI